MNKYGFKGGVDKQGKILAVRGGLAKKSFQFCSDGTVIMQTEPTRMPKPVFRTFRFSLGSVLSDPLLYYVPIISIILGYKGRVGGGVAPKNF